jgi:hypothetical protein
MQTGIVKFHASTIMLLIESQKHNFILLVKYPYVYSFDKLISLSIISGLYWAS